MNLNDIAKNFELKKFENVESIPYLFSLNY